MGLDNDAFKSKRSKISGSAIIDAFAVSPYFAFVKAPPTSTDGGFCVVKLATHPETFGNSRMSQGWAHRHAMKL